MKKPGLDDSFLLRAIQKGDKASFDTLFRRYYPVLCGYCMRFIETEEAKEVVQELMLWLWENRETINIGPSPQQYLFTAAYHRAMNRVQSNEIKQAVYAIYHERTTALLEDMDICSINELSKRIRKAVSDLPPSYRQVFIMHRFQEMSYNKIAEKLNISPKTVEYRISQSMRILKEKFKDYLPLALILLDARLVC